MDRSGRTPGQVLAEATWGALQAGWRGPVGADADHLKTGEDIDQCAAAGFTCFTIDPGEYVDGRASQDSLPVLQGKAAGLPWERLESDLASLLQRYAGYSLDLEQQAVTLNEATALRAAVKYAGAIAHVVRLYRRLEELGQPFELEVSVDETETPTSHAEHVFIAAELKRLGVRWASLAPRFVGRFEKGVDYLSPAGKMGDLEAFAEDVQGHAGIARALGPYKLSLHSGSDKFSIYPLVQEATRGLVHLKTAGTSYLEALRIISRFEPDLFREILCLAYERYAEDRVSYNVSASLVNLPQPEMISEDRFPALMQDFTAREVLHVTFGSALAVYGPQLLAAIRTHEEAYAEGLAEHFGRHLRAFVE